MSDAEENAMIDQNEDLPPQTSPTDTSNWDDKVSTDPSGEKYIRTDDQEGQTE